MALHADTGAASPTEEYLAEIARAQAVADQTDTAIVEITAELRTAGPGRETAAHAAELRKLEQARFQLAKERLSLAKERCDYRLAEERAALLEADLDLTESAQGDQDGVTRASSAPALPRCRDRKAD